MYLEGKNIKLSTDSRENLIEIDDKFFQISFLREDNKYVQGGNGIVFSLSDEQEGIEYVIKFLKYSDEEATTDWKAKKRYRRFCREIEALYTAKSNDLMGVIQIEAHGCHMIDGKTFSYYVMEKCDFTLKEFLEAEGGNLDIVQKTIICQKILKGIQSLHEYKIYHRDIKHDNIYFLDGEPIIGDLGLSDFQESDIFINEKGELIGPTGWFSPEAINKYLVEKTANLNGFDCTIDKKSEVFQLGKLFWYIYQGNIPIGHTEPDDFIPNNPKIYGILNSMLQNSKVRRFNTSQVAINIGDFLSSN
ncbi:serine/threonine protein kinase [Pedobacter sp. UYP30]|uniref:protein kinase domain-containing protein n=1 Tax=Pedobacter sp. UYP30 TaxID=1756400 RepID=UPI00339533DF